MGHNNNAKFAFWYLLSLVALIFMAIGSGQVIFQMINKLIPDFPGNYAGVYDASSLKLAISFLVISIPLFYIINRQIEKNLVSGDLDKNSPIRRWLTYAILFISSVFMIIWLIMTINNYLDGDLTSKFLLKTLTVLVIAGLTFAYYFYDSRRFSFGKKDTLLMTFLIVSLVITIGSFVIALFFVEKPAEARARRHDQEVLGHFSQLDGAINTYYSQKAKLPASLSDIGNDANYLAPAVFKDPQTGKAYDYKAVDKTNYQLCADFSLSNKNEKDEQLNYGYGNWPHDAGHQCLKHQVMTTPDAKMIPPVPAR